MSENSLGNYLRQERETKGITLEQVASATKISIRLLQALESDQYSSLPARPFVRGFVISYSRFVGLDAAGILTRYRDFIEKKALERPLQESGHSGYAFERRAEDRSQSLLWTLMIGFVIAGGVVMFVLKPAFKHKKATQIEKLKAAKDQEDQIPTPVIEGAPEKVAEKTPEKPVEKQASPVVEKPAVAVTKGVSVEPTRIAHAEDPMQKGDTLPPEKILQKVVLKSSSDLYVRYSVDGYPVRKFALLKDKMLVLRAESAIRVQVSKTDGVQLRYQTGIFKEVEEYKAAMQKGDTVTLLFPSELSENVEKIFPTPEINPPSPP